MARAPDKRSTKSRKRRGAYSRRMTSWKASPTSCRWFRSKRCSPTAADWSPCTRRFSNARRSPMSKKMQTTDSSSPLAGVGGYILESEPVVVNAGKPTQSLKVRNTGDRPIQVGSHFHFFEVNRALVFDRSAAYGMRLDLPAGTAVRFEPGEVKTVRLVALGGSRQVYGGSGLVMGALDGPAVKLLALERMTRAGFGNV